MKNKQTRRRSSAALTLLLVAAQAAVAAPAALARYGVAVYSDLCTEAQTGDVGGQRVTLHRYAEGDSVIYEFTAGSLSWPVVATDVSIDDGTGVLTFNVQEVPNGAPRTVIGRFSQRGRTLTLDGGYCVDGSMPMRLTKVTDFSRALPACKACPAPKADAMPAEMPAAPAMPPDPDPAPTLEQEEQREQQRQNPPVPVTPLDLPLSR